MKIKGRKIQPPKPIDVIFPRVPEEDNLHFKVQAVLDYDDFYKACPEPEPPLKAKPGDAKAKIDPNDKDYLKSYGEWASKQQVWMYLKSLSATDGLEFETISLADPDGCTFDKFRAEAIASGLHPIEFSHLIKQIRRANAMDESHLEEARKRFLLQQAEQKE